MGLVKLRVKYWDGVKIIILREGHEPESYEDFVLLLAAKVDAINAALQSYVLRLQYQKEGDSMFINLDDTDDLIVLYESLWDGGDAYIVQVEVEEATDANRHRMIARDGIDAVRRKLSSTATAAAMTRKSSATGAGANPGTMTSVGTGRSSSGSPSPDTTLTQGSTTGPSSPLSPASPAQSPNQQRHSTLGAMSSVAPTQMEWNLLVDSKSQGWWTDVQFNATKEQVSRVVEAWTSIKTRGAADGFSVGIRDQLMKQNPAYIAHFPKGIPAMMILEGITAQAHVLTKGKAQQDVLAELIYLGARHIKEWRIGENDMRLMVGAILDAFSSLPTAPGFSKDLLAWRSVLCEMAAIMARGCRASEREIAQVKAEMDAARNRAKFSRGKKEDCSVM